MRHSVERFVMWFPPVYRRRRRRSTHAGQWSSPGTTSRSTVQPAHRRRSVKAPSTSHEPNSTAIRQDFHGCRGDRISTAYPSHTHRKTPITTPALKFPHIRVQSVLMKTIPSIFGHNLCECRLVFKSQETSLSNCDRKFLTHIEYVATILRRI